MSNVLTFPSLQNDDSAARRLALDTQRSFIVEAPAGSGKTGLMVQRFLRLLLDPNVSAADEVLAITFTRKATAELAERVLEQLRNAAGGAPLAEDAQEFERELRHSALQVLERDRQGGWRLLEGAQRLNIRSIDSVCAAIANSVPVLSGSGGERTPVQSAEALYLLAARRTSFHLGGQDARLHAALRTVLLHRGGKLNDMERLIANMLSMREQWGELVPLDAASLSEDRLDTEVRPRLEASLESIACNGLQRALQLMPDDLLAELTQMAHRHSGEPGYGGQDSPLAICAGKQTPPDERAETLDHWRALIHLILKSDGEWRRSLAVSTLKVKLPKASADRLKEIIAEIQQDRLQAALTAVIHLPPTRYSDEDWHVAKALFLVLRHALAELKVLFAERSECDFTELSIAAREALSAEPTLADTALTSGSRLRHLLVDEMQDTSAAQYNLLELLTRSWDGQSQTLFLVGDPKQSIYAFRQADVTRFLRTVREECIGDVPLTALQLTANFRSQAFMVEGFNETFQRIFPPPNDDALRGQASDVPFVAALPKRSAGEPDAFHWHTTVLTNDDTGAKPSMAAYKRNEASEVRSILQAYLSEAQPQRIAVLARSRPHLTEIAKELRKHRIPYRAVEIDSLAERQEVLDALALTRALLHPADRIAWLSVLHAPPCGLGMADLLTLTREGPEADRQATVGELVRNRLHLLSEAGQERLTRVWTVLEAAMERRGQMPWSALIERSWLSLGFDAPLQPDERRNAERFFALLREIEQQNDGRLDAQTVSTRLAKLYAEADTTPTQIELMTIHKSKGLEWDVVLVPGLERRPPMQGHELLDWLQLDANSDDAGTVILAPVHRSGEKAGGLGSWLRGVRQQRDAAERKRLFYVACTRAREALHLFAMRKETKEGLGKADFGSLLEAVDTAAMLHFHLEAEPQDASANEPATNVPAYGLTLAAEADSADLPRPQYQRLPSAFDPLARFSSNAASRLSYEAAAAPPLFARPEGSLAARAFGNVVHRFLELSAKRLSEGLSTTALQAELPQWEPRLLASLRNEGLPFTLATREAHRALRALQKTMLDPTGLWLLMPHAAATSEAAFTSQEQTVRADRVFRAGAAVGQDGDDCLWIVDFKTTEQGTRSDQVFLEAEQEKYRAQLERYAEVLRRSPLTPATVSLALYYPLSGQLIEWFAP
ncbi:MAG: UvrD-helicase domain-containing protein [Acidobacteriaceae bacterium]|nr:UvrD-helicase domain-containing protein [Acidobacteriaceae bacterium]